MFRGESMPEPQPEARVRLRNDMYARQYPLTSKSSSYFGRRASTIRKRYVASMTCSCASRGSLNFTV